MKDYFDELMKKELLLMPGSEDDWVLELRKFPVTDVDAPNFESVTLEQLKASPSNKPIKLQQFNVYGNG